MAAALNHDLRLDEDPVLGGVLGVVLGAGLDPGADLHGHAVGHFLAGLAQHLFPDELRGHAALGLVGEGILPVAPFAHRRVPLQQGPQGFQVEPQLAAHRDDLPERQQILVGRDLLQQGAPGHQVQLVQHQIDRLPGGLEPLGQLPLTRAQEARGVHHPQQEIGLVQGHVHVVQHALIEGMLGQVHPRRVQEGQLGAATVDDAQDAAAGGLGHLADGGQLLADQGVQQGRLAGVGQAHQGQGGRTPRLNHGGYRAWTRG